MSLRLYPPLRPQSVSEVLDTAFHIFAASLLKNLPYGILLILAGQLVNIYSLATGRPMSALPHDAASGLVYGVSLVAVCTIWVAIILRQCAIAQGETHSMRAELTRALRVVPQIVVLAILSIAAFAVGLVVLVLPGIYLLVALSVALPALVLQRRNPIDAMKFSVHLMRGSWWRTLAVFVVTLTILFVFYILAIILAAVAVQFARGADIALVTAAATVLIIALGAFTTPFFAAALLAVFGDLLARQAAIAPSGRQS
jgi:hypothetical protein